MLIQFTTKIRNPLQWILGTDLYVHLTGEADPNTTTMTISRYNLAFYIEQDFIYLSDLTFQHYGQGSHPKAIYLNNASLTLSLLPPTLDPLGESTLAVIHTQTGAPPLPGVWFTLPITAAGGGITQSTTVSLLVGGACAFLPLIQERIAVQAYRQLPSFRPRVFHPRA